MCDLVILNTLVVKLLVQDIDLLCLVNGLFLGTGDPIPLTVHLVFEDYDSLFESLDMHALLVSHFFFLDKLLFEAHLLVNNLLLDRRLDTFKSHIVIDPLLVPFIYELRLEICNLKLKCHVIILDHVKLPVHLIHIVLCGNLALIKCNLGTLSQLSFESINFLLVKEVLFTGLMQGLLNS